MNAATIPGFDYVTGKAVEYTAAEWRAKYPRSKYVRSTSIKGETCYFLNANGRPRVAEAYAIIPAGKVSA